jgi:GT2 family glycosyltransferase
MALVVGIREPPDMLRPVIEVTRFLPSASVVIPTFNRRCQLESVLAAVDAQYRPWGIRCQVIVVDDGSSDGTAEWLRSEDSPEGLTVISQQNAGPARARNRGVEIADGDIVLFLGDDTVPQPGWLLEHLESQRISRDPTTVGTLGYTSFPASHDSPFLRWINEHGAQFGYALIDDPTDVPFNFFYTSNISIPRRMHLELGGFREDFPAAAWEDIEFAYRATQAGLRLKYLPRARTVHHHEMEAGSFCRRQKTSGLSGAIFAELHPELEGFLGVGSLECAPRWPGLTRRVLQAWIAAGERVHGLVSARIYQRFLDGCYLAGLGEGLERLEGKPDGR